jgi:uroporphyrinogen-III synthase
MSVRILSTKKLSLAQRQHLLMAGFHVVEADFISTHAIHSSVPELHDHIIITSQNALSFLLELVDKSHLHHKTFFCVGEKTAQKLNNLGMKVALWKHYAEELSKAIITDFADKIFTFVSGTLRRDVLPNLLQEHKVDFEEWQVYETALTPLKIEGVFQGILFFSPSGVESFFQLNTSHNAVCFSIGNTTQEALKPYTLHSKVANKPTVESTLIACIHHFNNPQEIHPEKSTKYDQE